MMIHQQQPSQFSKSGFTIVESLIAIVIVGILLSVIAPVIILAVGNRVQARRVELGTGAARTYINGVRSGAIAPPNHKITLNEIYDDNTFNPQRDVFAKVEVPTNLGSLNCTENTPNYPYCQNTSSASLYCIDLDGDRNCSSKSINDMVVQAFRSVTSTSPDNANSGYILGIRVYRTDAFSDNIPLVKSDAETKRTQATYSGGIGDRKAPVIELSTEITTAQTKLQDYCDRLGGCQNNDQR